MARLEKLDHRDMEAYLFDCPGCGMTHMITVKYEAGYKAACSAAGRGTPEWGFNGDMNRPTFTPSLLVRWDYWVEEHGFVEKHVCHSFIRNGEIEFLSDCTHKLKSQTVPLDEVKDG